MNEDSLRYQGSPWFPHMNRRVVNIIGIGGIGSWTAAAMSRLNLKSISLKDPDIVERFNMAGQMYGIYHVGRYKVSAMNDILTGMSPGTEVICENVHAVSCTSPGDYVMGLDNMQSRKFLFESWCMKDPNEDSIFIDGRMAAEAYQIFCFSRKDEGLIRMYKEKYLFSDSEALETECSYKQTTFMSMMMGGMMVNTYVNKVEELNGIDRIAPFLQEYSGPTMTQRIEL